MAVLCNASCQLGTCTGVVLQCGGICGDSCNISIFQYLAGMPILFLMNVHLFHMEIRGQKRRRKVSEKEEEAN